MRRTATILSGSACCVYGLTFTSHFYGARRTVGYVPFNSETLVRGQLYEDIRDAVYEIAKPADYDAVVVINLCVPTASGVPLDRLPKQIDGVRVIGIDVPGFGVPTHAEAKDVLAGAMLRFARHEAEQGPVARPRAGAPTCPRVALIGELFPADPPGVGAMLAPMGLGRGAAHAVARMARPVRRARLRGRGRGASVLHRQRPRVRRRRPPGRRLRPGRRRGHRRLARRGRPGGGRGGRAASTRPRRERCRRSAPRSPPTRSGARSPCRATRVRSCWSPAC